MTFTDAATGRDIGEADVLLLFADGSLVPVEVKRRLGGTEGRTAELMDALADALDAPYDVLAVTESARDCQPLAALRRDLPARPRVLLTNDQLHQEHVFWALGADPFAWEPLTSVQEAERRASFTGWLSNNDPDKPLDFVSSVLLDANLD